MTLPVVRMPRPLACRMMSRAWSQGTSCKRMVKLPATASEVMMLNLENSAITCKMERTSIF